MLTNNWTKGFIILFVLFLCTAALQVDGLAQAVSGDQDAATKEFIQKGLFMDSRNSRETLE